MTKKKKEKTAKNKGQWIAYVVYILTGAACGIFVPMYTGMAGQSEKGIFSDLLLSDCKSDVGKARRPHTIQEAAYRRNRRPMLDDTTRLEGRENAGNAV